MDHQQLKELDNTYFMPTYGRFDVDIDHGHGATLYDLSGKEYIDFSSGIGVNSIGCAHPRWVEAIAAQAAKLGHISNLFYTQPGARLAKIMCERSGMAGVFFSNSGAEANEGAIKLARKWSFDKYGKGRGTIITLKNSFHGRTAVTLKATGQEVFHNYFYPFPEGFRYAEAGDMASLEEVSGHDVCAVMLELVQGEGGVRPMEKAYAQALSALCGQRAGLHSIDEVQSGIGRTGTFFAYQQYGIVPDVVTFAKGVAGGLPMGGFLANEKCRGVLTAGTHGSTFGGNPVSAAAALAVMEVLSDETIAAVAEKGAYLRQKIAELGLSCLGDTRGLGLMIGVEVKGERSNKELAALLIQNGLLVLTGGKDLRLLPPLTITREEMDKGLAIMAQVLR